jgi:hypothetical protein
MHEIANQIIANCHQLLLEHAGHISFEERMESKMGDNMSSASRYAQ